MAQKDPNKLINFEDDALNKAMIDGLKNAFEKKMKNVLMEVAEKEIENIVTELSSRLEVKMKNWKGWDSGFGDIRHVKLEWLFKTEGGLNEDNS